MKQPWREKGEGGVASEGRALSSNWVPWQASVFLAHFRSRRSCNQRRLSRAEFHQRQKHTPPCLTLAVRYNHGVVPELYMSSRAVARQRKFPGTLTKRRSPFPCLSGGRVKNRHRVVRRSPRHFLVLVLGRLHRIHLYTDTAEKNRQIGTREADPDMHIRQWWVYISWWDRSRRAKVANQNDARCSFEHHGILIATSTSLSTQSLRAVATACIAQRCTLQAP